MRASYVTAEGMAKMGQMGRMGCVAATRSETRMRSALRRGYTTAYFPSGSPFSFTAPAAMRTIRAGSRYSFATVWMSSSVTASIAFR